MNDFKDKNLFSLIMLNSRKENTGDKCLPLPKELFLPVQHDNDNKVTKGYHIRLHLKGLNNMKHLLWNCIFKGIRIIDWYLLFGYLFRNLRVADPVYCACLGNVLKESSLTQRANLDFHSFLKPIHKRLAARKPKAENEILGSSFLEFLIQKLQLPQKGVSLNSILSFELKLIGDPVPKVDPYIGVGYKDKGSLGTEHPIGAPVLDLGSTDLIEESYFLKSVQDLSLLFSGE